MKYTRLKRVSLAASTVIGTIGLLTIPAAALAGTSAAGGTSAATSTSTPNSQARLQNIISRGNTEITRRLTILNTLSSKISTATKLSSSDQSTLTAEVTNEISGLTSLKTTLDGETQLSNAITDAQSIFTDYRVFALVVPQTYLVKTADDQQVAEGKLTTLATKIQSDITADQKAGKDVSALQTELNTLNSKVQAAQTISSTIETGVLPLTPNDYNTNHEVLSGDRAQLKIAQGDIGTALSDAKSLVSSLKSL